MYKLTMNNFNYGFNEVDNFRNLLVIKEIAAFDRIKNPFPKVENTDFYIKKIIVQFVLNMKLQNKSLMMKILFL